MKNKIEFFEKHLERKCVEFENKFTVVFEVIEKNNKKILKLESLLKEATDKIEQVLNEKSLNKNEKVYTQNDPPAFKCEMCDFESRSKSGLKTHIARKHTNYSENDVPIKCGIFDEKFKSEKDMKDHMISHSYHKSDLLQFKCDECDFWGPNAHTMKMHFRRLHSENVSCGICDLEMKDIETLDIHTVTCQRFKCNWCNTSFNNISELKSHSKQEHKGKNYICIYKRMRINDDFFSEDLFPFKDLV